MALNQDDPASGRMYTLTVTGDQLRDIMTALAGSSLPAARELFDALGAQRAQHTQRVQGARGIEPGAVAFETGGNPR